MNEKSGQDNMPDVDAVSADGAHAERTETVAAQARGEDAAQKTPEAAPAAGKNPKTLPVAIITGVVALAVGIAIGFAVGSAGDDGTSLESSNETVAAEETFEQEYTCTWYVYDSEEGEDAESAQMVLSTLVGTLPVPEWGELADDESSITLAGVIWTDSSSYVDIDLYDVSSDEYITFVNACIETGFDVDFDKSSSSFYAYNQDGVCLSLDYYSWDELDVNIEYSGSSESDPDLIDLLDDYEDFMEDYADFMQEYEAADASEQLDMISDYNDLVTEYAEFADDLEAYDTDDMSEDDYAYYLEVMEYADELIEDL